MSIAVFNLAPARRETVKGQRLVMKEAEGKAARGWVVFTPNDHVGSFIQSGASTCMRMSRNDGLCWTETGG